MNSKQLAFCQKRYSCQWGSGSIWSWALRPICWEKGHDLEAYNMNGHALSPDGCRWPFLDEAWVRCRRCNMTFRVKCSEWDRLVQEEKHGHRTRSQNPQGGTRALPAGTPGERPGGTQPVEGAGTGTSPVPIAQEIIAWRGWSLVPTEQGWRLRSLVVDRTWESATLVAHDTPKSDLLGVGIHACKTREDFGASGYCATCMGTVALSGIVVEGEVGYRAERATVRSLIVLGYPAPNVRPIEICAELAETYQCDVTWEDAPTRTYVLANYYQKAQQGLLAGAGMRYGSMPTASGLAGAISGGILGNLI